MQKEEFTLTQIDNFLYTSAKSDFTDFESMSRYLESIDIGLEIKISQLEQKRQAMLNQYKTSAMVYEIDSKRRKKIEAQMKEEYDKLVGQLALFQKETRLQVHPMTPDLRAKSDDLEKLTQTNQVLEDLNALMTGNTDNILSLDERNFDKTASKISVLKTVLQELTGSEYDKAKQQIDRRFHDLRDRIISKFQEGYLRKNTKQLTDVLPLCNRFNMMNEVAQFYIGNVFREVHVLSNIDATDYKTLKAEINTLFFLLQRGFRQALEKQDITTNEVNQQQLFKLFGDYSDNVLKALINYAFEQSIKVSMDNILKTCYSNQNYLDCLEMFNDEAISLVKSVQSLDSTNDSVNHLVESYLISLFDNYLEQYAYKQLGFLQDKYEEYTRRILSNLTVKVDLADKRKFDWKRLFHDYKIEQSEKLTAEDMDSRISTILSIFMDINLQRIFQITNKSLQRNRKIARYTQREKNQVKILELFGREMGEFLINLIKYTTTVVPGFNRKTPLSEQFFEIVPQLTTLVQRLELVFQTFAISKTSLNQAIKLEQNKEDIIQKCETQLQKLLQVALASLLVTENSLLKETSDYKTQTTGQSASQGVTKLIAFASKYLRRIRKNYSTSTQKRILEKMGNQFCQLLIQHFGTVLYNKQGLYQLFIDIGNLKKFIFDFDNPQVEQHYSGLKALVDIYLLKNDQVTLKNHVSQEKQRSLATVKDEFINRYLENKRRNQI